MRSQIKTLAQIELVNLFGLNVLRHTKDRKEKKKRVALAALFGVVILMAVLYVAGYSYGLIYLGLPKIVPVGLAAASGAVVFLTGLLKAGSVIFRRNGYDIVSSLPVSQTAIVVSRFLRMYVEDFLLTCLILLPGLTVYAVFEKPGAAFYLLGLLGIPFLPLIPLSIAVFAGALITGISSRMRNKALVEAALTVMLMVGILGASAGLDDLSGELDMEKLKDLAETALSAMGKMAPQALWLGKAMTENDFGRWGLLLLVSLAAFAATVALTAGSFHAICRKLFGTSARHDYQMQAQTQDALLISLCRRELKRYFSSGIYVSNTIIGPVLGVVASIALFAAGPSVLSDKLPFALDATSVMPFAIAGIFCMMNLSCVSLSMEGKNWWIAKSLPLDARAILDAKILASLVVTFPFYLVSEVFLFLALKPRGWDLIWLVLIPLLFIVFCAVFGIAVNLRLPLMKWDNEVNVVKQSASGAIGGVGGALFAVISAIVIAVVPGEYLQIARAAISVLVLGATIFLYRRNNRANLQEIA